MRVLVQRVSRADVAVEGHVAGSIGPGMLLLVGVSADDTNQDVAQLADKVANLRIFEDDDGKMNRSALQRLELGHEAGVLVVSQFTLYGDVRKGRRPSFVNAAAQDIAEPLVDQFCSELRNMGLTVAEGVFGAHMMVSLTNDGPVTIWIDSDELRRPRRGETEGAG